RVLIPGDEVAGASRAEYIGLAVAIEIADTHGPCFADLLVDQILRPGLALQWFAVIAEPGYLLTGPGSSRNIRFAVAVEVGDGHVIGPHEFRGEDELLPGLVVARCAAVSEPDQLADKVLDADHIGLAVAVDVRDGVTFEPPGLVLGNDVSL